MNAPLRQAERLGRLTTALGADTLALLRFDGTDHLNDLFEYRVEALATASDLDFDALIGTHATVTIDDQPFDGIVTQARWAGVGDNGHRYDLTLRPWFWLASRRRNQRIFHNKTVVQIVTELLADYAQLGEPALAVQLSGDYPSLEYTVQYRESDLDFVRRQLERHGISFHFRHAEGSHTLVLTDDVLAHDSIGARPFKSYDGHHQAEGEHFWDWAPERNITTGAIRLTDYNFKSPHQAMETEQAGDAAHAQGQIESFDYPGDYLAQDVGKIVAGLRTAQERGADRRNRAVGDCVSLRAGKRVALSGDPVPGTGESYLCLSASHHFLSEAYGSGGQSSDGYSFTGSYALMPDTAPMAPSRRTAVPVVHGPQTAMVVGEGEIDCDEYGRILVRFHWDLDGAHSMRCRVSQNWAGNGWGGMVIPRIGMEVVVEFLEGDPDKPLVTGCVYNGKNAVPYDLPANKTKSTFRTHTHNSTLPRAFNELTFEDEAGREEILIRASRDLTVKVDQHATARIDETDVRSVGGDYLSEVEMSRTDTVGKSYAIHVGGGSGGMLMDGDARRDPFGLRPAAHRIGQGAHGGQGSFSVTTERNIMLDAGGAFSIDCEGSAMERVGKRKALNVAGTYSISVGENAKEVVTGRKVIDAHSELLLRCGASSIKMTPDGVIEIRGTELRTVMTTHIKLTSAKIDLN